MNLKMNVVGFTKKDGKEREFDVPKDKNSEEV